MARELPWLEPTRDEDLAALLARKGRVRLDSLVVAIDAALQRKPATARSEVERDVLAIEALERDVNHDGFAAFLEYSAEHVARTPGALDRAGCAATAVIVRDAIALLGLGPHPTRAAIEKRFAAVPESGARWLDALEDVTDRFLAYPDPIADRLLAYIEAHASEIELPRGRK